MGKYPVDITDEENAKLKYPFKPTEEYDDVIHCPDGPTIMFTGKVENIPKKNLIEMVRINQKVAARKILEEQDKAAAKAGKKPRAAKE